MSDCSERHRLALKVAKTVSVVDELKDRQREAGKKNDGLSILLDQARTAHRNAER
jgi:hypothetical protein